MPFASNIFKFEPIAAAIGSSIVNTSTAPVECAACSIDLCSTDVTPFGIHIIILGLDKDLPKVFIMKAFNSSSAISISDITPSLSGLINFIESGVFPSNFLASFPTARIEPSFSFTASNEGSSKTTPRPFT